MNKHLLFLTLCFFYFTSHPASAQKGYRADTTETGSTIILMADGQTVPAVLLKYEFGDSVVVRLADGSRVNYPWKQIRRIRMDRRAMVVRSERPERPAPPPPPPPRAPRKTYHELAGFVPAGLIRTSDRFFGGDRESVSFGMGGSYHFGYAFGRLGVAAGIDYGVYSRARNEHLGSVTARADYHFGDRRVTPFLRAEAGVSTLIGNLGGNITDRSIDPLFHPAIGLALSTDRSPDRLRLDLGYRFVSTSFRLETNNLEVIEREVSYRRLVIRLGFQLR